MKKTISVNIKGFHFLIEEEGYKLLQAYLDRLKESMRDVQGHEEIIEDIEIRIAELCSEQLERGRQVVETEAIREIIGKLGKPEDFLDVEEENEPGEKHRYTQAENDEPSRRLFRDDEHAMIGGVCAGLSNFTRIDVTIIRLLFLIFFGLSWTLYIILWIIIPQPNSTIDRLKMKGQPITFDNIREEVEAATGRIAREGKRVSRRVKREFEQGKRFSSLGNLIRSLIGIVLILGGIGMLITFVVFVASGFQFIPIEGDNGYLSFQDANSLLLSSPDDAWWGMFFVTIAVVSLILLFISHGSYLIFRIKNKLTRILSIGLTLICITSGIFCFVFGARVGRDFSMDGKLEREIGAIASEELVIRNESAERFTDKGFLIREGDHAIPLHVSGNQIINSGFDIRYRVSPDSLFHIYQRLGARGKSTREAVHRAENIVHNIRLQGDSLFVENTYHYPKSDLIRAQYSELLIEIPAGAHALVNGTYVDLESVREDGDHDLPARAYGHVRMNGRYEHYGN